MATAKKDGDFSMTETIKFATACKNFFGLKEGQKLTEFAHELRDLTLVDREELSELLSKELGKKVDL